jgi:hypothetical protein
MCIYEFCDMGTLQAGLPGGGKWGNLPWPPAAQGAPTNHIFIPNVYHHLPGFFCNSSPKIPLPQAPRILLEALHCTFEKQIF